MKYGLLISCLFIGGHAMANTCVLADSIVKDGSGYFVSGNWKSTKAYSDDVSGPFVFDSALMTIDKSKQAHFGCVYLAKIRGYIVMAIPPVSTYDYDRATFKYLGPGYNDDYLYRCDASSRSVSSCQFKL